MRESDIDDGSPQIIYCDSPRSATGVEDNLKDQKPHLEDLESGSRSDVSSGQSDGMCLYLSSRFNSVISSRHWICKYGCSCNRRTWTHEKGRGQPKTTRTRQKKTWRRESQEARRTNQLEVTAEVKIKIKAGSRPRWRQRQHQQLGQRKGGKKAKARTWGSKSHGLYSHSIIDPTTHIQLEIQGERFHTPGFYQRTLFFSDKSNLWRIQGHSSMGTTLQAQASSDRSCLMEIWKTCKRPEEASYEWVWIWSANDVTQAEETGPSYPRFHAPSKDRRCGSYTLSIGICLLTHSNRPGIPVMAIMLQSPMTIMKR